MRKEPETILPWTRVRSIWRTDKGTRGTGTQEPVQERVVVGREEYKRTRVRTEDGIRIQRNHFREF